jgi:hypothetical protein
MDVALLNVRPRSVPNEGPMLVSRRDFSQVLAVSARFSKASSLAFQSTEGMIEARVGVVIGSNSASTSPRRTVAGPTWNDCRAKPHPLCHRGSYDLKTSSLYLVLR